jgi:2-iminoacetate synthase
MPVLQNKGQALAKSKEIEIFSFDFACSATLEEMAQLTHELTKKRFGKTIQMYAPLYVSNECQNICTYCGFSLDNKIKKNINGL